MEGTVRFYSAKGFGFIDPSDGEEALYFHIAGVINKTILRPGDVVTFNTIPGHKGPKCVNVQLIQRETADVHESISSR